MSAWGWIWRVGGVLVLLLILVVAGLLFYASTPHFANIVRQKVVTVLEDATGGRVEIQSMRWNLRHLAVEADNLTIHGLESRSELPYAHIDRLYARARILSFVDARLGLDFLEVDRPAIHIIVYPDGRTNQPIPKATQIPNGSATKTIFDLQARRVEVHNGMALINERSIPFQLAANDLGVVITYAPLRGHYLGEISCSDIAAQKGKSGVVHSRLDLSVEAAPDAVDLKTLHFTSQKTSLQASGSLTHFARPQWNLSTNGTVDLAEVTALGAVDGFKRGSVDLALTGQGSGTDQYVLDGQAKVVNASYAIEYFWADGVNATTHLHVTPDEITLPDLVGRPRQGGTVNAALRFLHWQAPDRPAKAPGAQVMSIRARVSGVRLSTVLASVVPPHYRDLGFDTAGEGNVSVDWTGSPDDLTVAAVLAMSAPDTPTPGLLPLSGSVDAKYFQRGGRVDINRLEAHSPATTLNVSGPLGVYPVERPSNLSVHLVTHNLGEFDHVLKALDLGINGKPGIGGLPVSLQGDATFDGSGTGSLVDPAFQGHLTASRFSTLVVLPASTSPKPAEPSVGPVALPAANSSTPTGAPAAGNPTTIHWDSLDTTASYSSSLISVDQATLMRGKTVIHASGRLEAHHINRRKVAFDDQATINATAQMQDASLTDLLALAGQDLPVTGTLNMQAHAGGMLGNLNGGSNLTLQGGAIEGQPYHSLTAALTFAGQDINLTKLTLLQDGGTVEGNGTYNLKSRSFLGNLDGTNFELAHFPQPKDPRLSIAGALKFDAHASGTIDSVSVLAGIHLRNLILGGQPAGGLEAVVHTQGSTAYFTARNSLATAQLQAKGETQLHDNFQTKANVVLTNLNIAPFLRAMHVQSVSGNSSIGGTVNVAGPLREPKQFSGDAEINQFAVTLQGIALQAEGPLRASLQDGVLHLTQAHITGPDTNLSVTGTAALMDDQALAVTGDGTVNMKLAQTFDPDITSSGHVDFNVEANGTLTQPSFSGRMHLTNVALALNDLPNGISKLNGNLIFDQNRLAGAGSGRHNRRRPA